MEKRNNVYVGAARNYFNLMPLADENYNADMFYESFQEHACLSYAMLWCLENGRIATDEALY